MRELLNYCESLPEVSVEPGVVLLAEGAKSGLIFVLIEGEVDILKKDFRIAKVDQPGSLLGEISALLDIPHIASVVAKTSCRLYKIENQSDFLKSKTEFTYPLAVLLAKKLNTITNYLADIREQYNDRGDHLGMVDQILEELINQQDEEQQPGSDRDLIDGYPY